MGASVGGGPIGAYAISMISLMLVLLLFLYGSYSAYRGSKSMPSLGLLVGTFAVLLSVLLYFITTIIIYNNYGDATNVTAGFVTISIYLFSGAILIKAVSFVLFVRRHNKLLKAMDAANRSAS